MNTKVMCLLALKKDTFYPQSLLRKCSTWCCGTGAGLPSPFWKPSEEKNRRTETSTS